MKVRGGQWNLEIRKSKMGTGKSGSGNQKEEVGNRKWVKESGIGRLKQKLKLEWKLESDVRSGIQKRNWELEPGVVRRKREVESGKQEVRSGKRVVGCEKLKAGSGKWKAGSGSWEVGSEKGETGSEKWEAGIRKREAGSWKREAGSEMLNVKGGSGLKNIKGQILRGLILC